MALRIQVTVPIHFLRAPAFSRPLNYITGFRIETMLGLVSKAYRFHSGVLVKTDAKTVGVQTTPKLSAPQPGSSARLIVVSNRLPLTLRKTDDPWKTEHSSGGL